MCLQTIIKLTLIVTVMTLLGGVVFVVVASYLARMFV